MHRIKFAVLGCGHIGKRHAAVIAGNPACELVALCDEKPAGTLDIANREIPFFRSAEELLQSGPAFDVLSIATPNGLHEAHALQGIAGGHHVVIEKPMALTAAGCERIIQQAADHDKQVFCIMQNRYSPPASWLKGVVEAGLLGKIYMVQVNCFWNRDENYYNSHTWHGSASLDGGALFTQFSHFVDMVYWLFGDIDNIEAVFKNFNHPYLAGLEDAGCITFDLVNGGMGSFNYSTAVWQRNFESSLTVIAEHGTVKLDGQYMNQLAYCNIKDYTMPVLPVGKGQHINHYHVFENVAAVLNGNGKAITNAQDGLHVVSIIERIYSQR